MTNLKQQAKIRRIYLAAFNEYLTQNPVGEEEGLGKYVPAHAYAAERIMALQKAKTART